MKRGDVFTISTRGLAAKPRPGVVVHASSLIRANHPVLVCPLTSDLVMSSIVRPTIEPSTANGLRVVSQAMVDRLTGALPREIGNVTGHLDDDQMRLLELALLTILGLGRALTTFSKGGEVS